MRELFGATLIAAAFVLCGPSQAAPAPKKSQHTQSASAALRSFEFRGRHIGDPPIASDAEDARLQDLGGVSIDGIHYVYDNNGRLSSLSTSTISVSASLLEKLLEAKYGQPAVSKNEPLQNGYGAIFDNPIYEWHFREGTLRLVSRTGYKGHYATLTFENRAEEEKAGEKIREAAKNVL